MPVQRTNPKTRKRAIELRLAPTLAEAKLWLHLRVKQLNGHSFRRQHVDLEAYDLERTAYLQSRGYRVLRFWNDDVQKNIDGVVEVIVDELGSHLVS